MSIQHSYLLPRLSPGRTDAAHAEETSFAIWRVDDTHVVRVDGVLDLAAAVRLRLTLYGRLDAGASTVVVDLAGVRLIDASAVNVLLTVHGRLTERGGGLAAPGAGGLVLRVLEIAGAAKRLQAYDTLEPRLVDRGADAGDRIDATAAGTHGSWGDEVNNAMGRLGALAADDVTGRRNLRDEVIRLFLPLAERLARRFYGLGEPAADLNQVAALGLLKAVDRYDPSLGTDFPSFATPTIVGDLKRHFRDRGWSVRVPRRLQELRLDINRARDQLTHELGRASTVADRRALNLCSTVVASFAGPTRWCPAASSTSHRPVSSGAHPATGGFPGRRHAPSSCVAPRCRDVRRTPMPSGRHSRPPTTPT